MRNLAMLRAGLALGGILLLSGVLTADEPESDRPVIRRGVVVGTVLIGARPQATVTARPVVTVGPKDVLIDELVTILGETESVETYMLTIATLGKLKADGQLVIPAILRNAERLGVYRNRRGKDGPDTEEMMEMVASAIEEFLSHVRTPSAVMKPTVPVHYHQQPMYIAPVGYSITPNTITPSTSAVDPNGMMPSVIRYRLVPVPQRAPSTPVYSCPNANEQCPHSSSSTIRVQ